MEPSISRRVFYQAKIEVRLVVSIFLGNMGLHRPQAPTVRVIRARKLNRNDEHALMQAFVFDQTA